MFLRTSLLALLLAAPALAQVAKPPSNFTFSGDLEYRTGGVRLTANARGPARVRLPQLDASAQALAVDSSGNAISQVRALGNVNFKLNLVPKGGGAPARIEATCERATLFAPQRRLVLQGKVRGFYQLAGGARQTLAGETATLYYQGQNLVADLTGGVQVRIPAETVGRPDALGDITISSQRAQVNQGDRSAIFAGNARAVSGGGPNAFDVSAPRFTLTRGAGGAIDTLKTTGRTLVKLDLPPDPAPNANGVGTPTHVEVAADSATIQRGTSTAIFEGNVKGFYRLTQGGTPQNFDFAGTRAVIRYVPTAAQGALAGLNVQVTDATVEGPAFDLGF